MTGAHYLLQANIYLVVFYGFYRLLLDRETYFTLNRIYLISAALFSLMIPFIHVDWFDAQPISQNVSVGVSQLYMIAGIGDQEASGFSWGNAIALLYVSGVFIFLMRFLLQLFSLRKTMQRIPEGSAFSFFNRMFVHPQLPGQNVIQQHEQTHMRQMHSLDVVFFELVGIMSWFNPVIYFYKQSIKDVHEYLADEEAARFQGDKAQYSMLLLSKAFGVDPNMLTNSFFNKSMVKKRIAMLHKEKSTRTKILKYGLFLPLFALTLILSSATIRKNETIRVAAESIPLEEPLKIVEDAWPNLREKEASTSSKVSMSKDTVNGRWLGFYAFLASKLRYPEEAQEAKLQGNAQVSFSILNGGIRNVESQTHLGMGCDEQVMKTLLAFPNYKNIPDGKYMLQVAFKYQGSTTALKNENLATVAGYTTLNPLVVTGYPEEAQTASANQAKVFDFVSVDKAPGFPGGIEKFYAFIGKNIKYPQEAVKNNVQGKVFLQFVVEADGSLSNIKVDKGLGSGTDEEAIRVLKASPRWTPGMKNNEAVRVLYHIPLSFTLHKTEKTATPESTITKLSISTKGEANNKPTYFINGEEASVEAFEKLNLKNITSVNVIKASDKQKIDGTKIANDVIIIKLKQGKTTEKPL
jgi:TonB family protein